MKTIISSILVITLLAMPVWSITLPYFKVSKAYITPLDSDSYRLRVELDWQLEPVYPPDQPGVQWGPTEGWLYGFSLSSPAMSYNHYATGYEFWLGNVTSSVSAWHSYWGTLGQTFGYDFDSSVPPAGLS